MKKHIIFSMLVILTTITFPVLAVETRYDFNVEGVTWASYVPSAEKEFKAMDGVKSVNTDLDTGIVSVCVNENVTFNDEQLKALFLEKGFNYKGMTKRDQC